MALFLPWMLLASALAAESSGPFESSVVAAYQGEIRGAALDEEELLAWGDRLLSFRLADGRLTTLDAGPRVPFAAAGCLFDADGDGKPDLVLSEAGPDKALVWLDRARRVRHVIDTGVETPDLLPASLHGRRGVLVVQKYMQVRFYEPGERPSDPWPYRDVYSIYTPSRQAGLVLADVNGDGRADIFCGNYWIRSPERFDLSWRLFNIAPWNETPDAATLRLAFGRGVLYASQGEVARAARLAWFEPTSDPRRLWIVHRLDEGLELRYPRALALVGENLFVGEDAGPGSRLLLCGRGREPQVLATGDGFRLAVPAGTGVLTIGAGKITYWRSADMRRPRESSPPGPARKRR